MRLTYLALGVLTFFSCSSGTAENSNAAEAEPFDAYEINEADWVEKDLGQVSNLTPVTLKVPKDAVLEKNGNGGVDIKMGDYYVVTVSQPAVSSTQEAIDDAKSLSVNNKTYYEKGTIILEEPNGFVYSLKPKDEANFKYEPEAHFFYVLATEGGAYFTFRDNEAFGTSIPGSGYPEENAKKVYDIIKSSARVNE